jgi:hypothetical protein
MHIPADAITDEPKEPRTSGKDSDDIEDAS